MSRPSEKLFAEAQSDFFEKSYEENVLEEKSQPVECLGMTFTNDEERRKHFLDKLREKLKDPEFRKIEGFPIGSDEDILALSDPPYYTACPNPFIADFIKLYGKPYDPSKPYSREPFAADVSEGKNDPIYKLHSYHTKVPYKSIAHFIEHFTEPGDVVLDVFGGSGMTAVAASQIGRIAISCDLSPFCSFVTHNYTFKSPARSLDGIEDLIEQLEVKYHDAISTIGADKKQHRIRFTVWSDVLTCPECSREMLFWGNGVEVNSGKMPKVFFCPYCHCEINSLTYEKVHETYFDPNLNKTCQRIKRVPVLINSLVKKHGYEKYPDSADIEVIRKYESAVPVDAHPIREFIKGDMYRSGYHFGMTHVHHFFDQRALCIAEDIRSQLRARYGNYGLFVFTSLLNRLTKMNRFIPHKNGSGVVGPFSGTLYMPPLQVEREPLLYLRDKVKTHRKCAALLGTRLTCSTTQSATDMRQIPDDCVDYVFIDPPFGSNLMYSELNFLSEYWLDVFSNAQQEAIQNEHQKKGLAEYRRLMNRSFRSVYRVLKPGRWLTVEFHNSNNVVWQALQTAIWEAGFVIADVRVLDKRKITMLQGTHSNIAKQDLVISAYKPNGGLEDRFKLEAGTEDGVWDFIRTHLKQLPVFVSKDGQAEVVAERQNYLLFDRMIAFHVQRGVTVPLSAAEFYAGLEQRFPPRDGMYFLPEQVAEYDKKRMTVQEVLQLRLFVTDESSAIQWLKQQLIKKSQTFQELHPQFLKEIGGWQKYEKPLELSELLEQNFLRYDGKGEVPNQIHSYLSTNFKELRNLPKDDESLRAKGKDRWYVPDPNKAGDLEKLRERSLLKEFEDYRASSQKRLKVFRLEAVRAGFKKAWQEHDYTTIITVARKIPENVLQEDPKLLMWYDQAITRSGEE
ncbi:MAG: DNA methylase [Deltaproteobacteria bacterium]|nr:MAG: DNA methylase [Deltaproteobacteria bacterium]